MGRMLHASLRGRQVRALLIMAMLCIATALLPAQPAAASRSEDLAAAAELSRTGRHAEAARLYERLAKRPLRGWDARVALLAARDYLAAGQVEDADRMSALVEGRVRGDDATLYARVRAEVLLARGDPAAAIEVLRRLPQPWPAPLAAELLQLQARAQFDAGQALEGMRSVDERVRVLGTAEARAENYRWMLGELGRKPAVVPPGATDQERAWFELAAMLVAAGEGNTVPAQQAADWRRRHPNHPGTAFLPETAAGTEAPREALVMPAGAPSSVALLLPLSGRQEMVGDAIRDGFLAACLERAATAPRVRVYDTAGEGAVQAYRRAITDGAQFVVGPLLREDVAAVVAAQGLPVPTLALNAYAGAPPPFLFQFTLDPEQEARAAARRISADGHVRGIALFPLNAWGERLRAAFVDELRTTGVELLAEQWYEPGARDFSGPLRAALGRYGGAGDRTSGRPAPRRDAVAEARDGPQFAFVAANAPAAKALKPQLRFQMTYDMPVYATSDAWDPSTRSAADLDGLLFPEMPWVLYGGQGAPRLWAVLHDQWSVQGRGRLRLYALGYDALQVIGALAAPAPATGFDGLTGRLETTADGRVRRELEWARIVGGHPQSAGLVLPAPVQSATPAPVPGEP